MDSSKVAEAFAIIVDLPDTRILAPFVRFLAVCLLAEQPGPGSLVDPNICEFEHPEAPDDEQTLGRSSVAYSLGGNALVQSVTRHAQEIA